MNTTETIPSHDYDFHVKEESAQTGKYWNYAIVNLRYRLSPEEKKINNDRRTFEILYSTGKVHKGTTSRSEYVRINERLECIAEKANQEKLTPDQVLELL